VPIGVLAENESDNTLENEASTNDSNLSNDEALDENEEDYETQLQNLQTQKDSLNNAISANEAQIGVVEGVLSETLEEIETLSTKIEEKKNEIADLETSEISLMNFIEKEEAKLQEYNEEYEKQKETLEKRLIVMYEMGNTTYLDVLLSSKSISEFLSKYYLLSEISESDYKLVESVKKSKNQAESVTKSLAEKKEELEKNKEDLDKYQISLSNMEILKTNKLASLSDEEVNLYNEIEEYREKIANIESEIKEIALKNTAEIYIGGSFIWPTPRVYNNNFRIWNENTSNHWNI
jgi:peptidoglycan hydrolase CwlO-like protein